MFTCQKPLLKKKQQPINLWFHWEVQLNNPTFNIYLMKCKKRETKQMSRCVMVFHDNFAQGALD